ncbi:LuxR family two component transcriptional regulator [Variovorax sp. 54]|uniref:response regulator transcription factor n=1 Tax=Variovorax sp. 54 TaxID=2035212 RepID=UPI000C5A29C1|nr:response regulator transcription factor [Variovorax sp. 54]PIF78758.1 LuxR family two component transcriptional regulator [Variovorax sp. 54]
MTRLTAQPLRLMVLDDHAVVRHGLITRLADEPDLSVVGSYGTSRELLGALATLPVDIVLMDFSLGPSDIDGLNLIRALTVRHPRSKTIVISAHYSVATVALALKAGARGYVGKGQELGELVAAIRTVSKGRIHLHPHMAADIASHAEASPGPTNAEALTKNPLLSPREREVLRCCLEGLSVTQIAAKFSRNVNTISTQKQAAFRKLGIRRDNELFKIRHQLDKT